MVPAWRRCARTSSTSSAEIHCTERKVSFWYGAQSLREAFYIDHFDKIAEENDNFEHGTSRSLILSPKITGPVCAGFIHQVLLEEYLK